MSRIPEQFIPFLGSLTFTSPNEESLPIVELWRDVQAMKADGHRFIKKGVALYSRNRTQVTIAGFRQKLQGILRDEKHVATEAIADAILGCSVMAAFTGEDRASFLEDLLKRFEPAEVSHFYVLPNEAITPPMHFEGYTLGPINLPVLASRCKRAQSNYAELYSAMLDGRFTLQSPEFKHIVIDFLKPMLKLGLISNNAWRDLLLNYFERVSRQHFEFMWTHLGLTQVMAVPFGAQILDANDFRNELGKFAQQITIYLDFSAKDVGYVVPEGKSITVNQPGPESEVFKRFADHRKKYRTSEVGDSELGRTLYACAGFCQQAMRFLQSGRADDAALYATICLEHLFSEKQSTSAAVCSRTAIVTHLRMADGFANAEKELNKLYNARSAFVHSGESVTPAQAERLIDYARETLRSMLVLHFKPENRSAGFLEKWVKNLDFIVAGVQAGKIIDAAFLSECGIFKM